MSKEYGCDIKDMKLFQDKEMTIEFTGKITNEQWHQILGGIPIIRCKDCKYFELDHFDIVEEVPLISHEICTKWGKGCKTSQDGYCFMAERKEE